MRIFILTLLLCTSAFGVEKRRNRLSLIYNYAPTDSARCGVGPEGLRCGIDRELNVGVQYMRDVHVGKKMNVHLLGSFTTNRTFGVGFGIGF